MNYIGISQFMSPEQRVKLWAKKLTNGCWEWTGGLTDRGYARIKIYGKTRYVHRRYKSRLKAAQK